MDTECWFQCLDNRTLFEAKCNENVLIFLTSTNKDKQGG